jgi:hypothetical protein
MARTRELECAHCGRTFKAPIKPGPLPKYCSPAHRQRAHEQRHRDDDATALRRAVEQIEAYQISVRQLEADNRRLREALAESEAEATRLYLETHPPPPHLAHLYGIDPTAMAEPPASSARGRRGRRGSS